MLDCRERLAARGDEAPRSIGRRNCIDDCRGWSTLRVHQKLELLVSVLAIAFAAWFVATGVWIGVVGYSATPYWDQWNWLLPDELLEGFFAQHNEHRIVVSRAIFLIDAWVGGGAGIINIVMMFVFAALHAALLFVLLCKAFGLDDPARRALLALGIAAYFFTGFQFENFVSGFQSGFTAVFFFASAAFTILAYYAERGGARIFALAVLMSFLSAGSVANGIFVAPVMVVVAVLLRLRRRDVAILAVVSIVTVLAYMHGYSSPSAHGDPLARLGALPSTVGFFLAYLGSALPGALNARVPMGVHLLPLAQFFGAIGVVGAMFVLVGALRDGARAPYRTAAAAILAFVMATAAITALGRTGLGDLAALASRYGAATASFWAILFALALSLKGRNVRIGAGVTVVAAAVILASAQMSFTGIGLEFAFRKREAGAALLAQVDAPDVLRAAFPVPEYMLARAEVLRTAHQSLFSEPWSRLLGAELPDTSIVCPGGFAGASRVIPSTGAATRVSVFGRFPREARAVALVDPHRRVVGLAIRHMRDDPDLPWPANRSRRTPIWTGFARLPVPLELRSIVVDRAGGAICRLDGFIVAGG